jgi:hypothetical protein
MRLYVEGGTAGELGKVAFDRAEILKVLRAGGEIDCGQALQLRICLGSQRSIQCGLRVRDLGHPLEVIRNCRRRGVQHGTRGFQTCGQISLQAVNEVEVNNQKYLVLLGGASRIMIW